jgi:hypothetical protein
MNHAITVADVLKLGGIGLAVAVVLIAIVIAINIFSQGWNH